MYVLEVTHVKNYVKHYVGNHENPFLEATHVKNYVKHYVGNHENPY